LPELKLTVKGDCVELEVRAKPNAERTSIVGVREGILDVRVAARPVEGAPGAGRSRHHAPRQLEDETA
jgi:uncharacterized protein YggU (UPF0235/DUF167 family)